MATPGPSTAMNSSAMSSPGMDSTTSRKRLMTPSANRPPSPAANPRAIATIRASAVAPTPMASELCAPKTTRV